MWYRKVWLALRVVRRIARRDTTSDRTEVTEPVCEGRGIKNEEQQVEEAEKEEKAKTEAEEEEGKR